MAVQHYRQLIAWQKAMELVKLVYELTAKFPKEELYGITGQMRRAAVAIPSNIAEGQGRNTTKDFFEICFNRLRFAFGIGNANFDFGNVKLSNTRSNKPAT
jgi:hypothetical protein